jgi:KipI family sensor histidine kinase inhibitor
LLPRVVPFGETALLVEWTERPDLDVNARVHALAAALGAEPPPGLVDITPGYVTLLVEFDPLATDVPALELRLANMLTATNLKWSRPGRLREIPTVYGGEFGPDLEAVAAYAGLGAAEIVRRHSETVVTVYMLGFSPGYPYMGDLPPELALPRRSTPRERVAVGSIAIADGQTSIYTRSTPGGWHLIGRTPRVLFDPNHDPPAYLAPGDRVRHMPITLDAWNDLAGPAADW